MHCEFFGSAPTDASYGFEQATRAVKVGAATGDHWTWLAGILEPSEYRKIFKHARSDRSANDILNFINTNIPNEHRTTVLNSFVQSCITNGSISQELIWNLPPNFPLNLDGLAKIPASKGNRTLAESLLLTEQNGDYLFRSIDRKRKRYRIVARP